MTVPPNSPSYRTRWSSQGHIEVNVDPGVDLEKLLIIDMVAQGWVQEKTTPQILTFSTYAQDSRKWTKEFNRLTCRMVSEKFSTIEGIAGDTLQQKKISDWPPGEFGD